jgi:hypothetical protein
VFILEHYLALKSSADVREEFSNPDSRVPNTTTEHLLVKNSGVQKVCPCDKCASSDRTVEITAVPQLQRDAAARIQ